MGGEVLAVVRRGLYLDFRFLDMALSALNPAPDERCRVLATDGQTPLYLVLYLIELRTLAEFTGSIFTVKKHAKIGRAHV